MRGPTAFEELNDVLADLTGRTRAILGSRFVGAYVQGSVALGDVETDSDCDFLIAVDGRVTSEEEAALRALHDELPTREGYWTQNLEGSYPPVEELRTLRGLGAPWLYIDHGWREMQWSTHCNSEEVRWILRERGITVAGPDPRTLLDPVPADALRERMREQIPTALSDIAGWISFDLAWTQRYAVTTLCRMLFTLDTGRVASKRAALEWAGEALEPRWRPLLRQVLEDRALGFDPDDPPRPGSLARTMAFADHARELSRRGRVAP